MAENNKIVIKKYPNRRLYNTESSSYITLEELSDLIKSDYNIVVLDAKSGEDLTRVTLTQIILEHESKGYNLLPTNFLKQIIKLYDNELSTAFNAYLTYSMEYFMDNQHKMHEFINSMGGSDLFTNNWTKMWEKYSKKNADFIQTMLNNIAGFKASSKDNKTNKG